MKIGRKAPEFALKDRTGKSYSLKSFTADNLIVYFYPKDDTPGCTIQAQEFSKSLAALARQKAQVVGISGGDERTKASFCKKFQLKLVLLSDPGFETSKAWGAYGEKSFMGRKSEGILRNTYLLNRERKIVKIFEKVKPETHLEEIFAALGAKNPLVKAPVTRAKALGIKAPAIKGKAVKATAKTRRAPVTGTKRAAATRLKGRQTAKKRS